ncbi:MAG: gliding motility lipoprotein GldB [Capnocytophaga sp.]|nr:gliding motility lipoprotein GldB [Capnocytophaga sp.]
MAYRFIILLAVLLSACNSDKREAEIRQIPMEIEVIRFDSLFFNTPSAQLPLLESEFPYMFPGDVPDSVWIEKQHDTLQTELYDEVRKQFGDFSKEKKEIADLFRHIKYYFPKFEPPKIITLTSDVDYHSRVIYADSLLLIGLDNYLDKDHRFYANIQEYIRFHLQKENVTTDIAEVFAEQLVPRKQHLSFLDVMIYEGKKLYAMQQLLPQKTETELLGYDPKKWQWAEANEAEIWRYYIENELLYQSDKRLLNRFIYPAPFSKFYMELDQESPGRIGRYIGLKIVTSYMKKHPETSLVQMLALNSDELFKQSYYKPKK